MIGLPLSGAAALNEELEKTADTRGVGDEYREAVIEYKKMSKFGRAKLRWLRRPTELKRFWAVIVSIFRRGGRANLNQVLRSTRLRAVHLADKKLTQGAGEGLTGWYHADQIDK